MNMDPAQLEALAAAVAQAGGGDPAQQVALDPSALAAIQAAILQAADTGGLEGMGKGADDYQAALLTQMAVAAAAGADPAALQAAVNGLEGMTDPDGGVDASPAGGPGDKPLTSRYRGVCWNKKNRRWQAAINSSGKYIYLGSFVQEEEAARAFDRAAIRLRGNRAKLNFALSDYMDSQGNLVEDVRLSTHLANVLSKSDAPKLGKGGMPGDGADFHGLMNNEAMRQFYAGSLTQQIISVGGKSPHFPYSSAQRLNYGVVEVPEGCSLVAHIPGDADAFAVLYSSPQTSPTAIGASVWDGTGCIDMGIFDSDKDARLAATSLLKLCMFNRHSLLTSVSGIPPAGMGGMGDAAGMDPAAQLNAALSMFGMMGQDGAGVNAALAGLAGLEGGEAALAAAAAAAAAANGMDPAQAAAQLNSISIASLSNSLGADANNQYRELFTWLAGVQQQGPGGRKPEEIAAAETAAAAAAAAAAGTSGGGLEGVVPGAGGAAALSVEDLAAAAAGMEAAAASAVAVAEGAAQGGVDDQGAAKRARMDQGGLSQIAGLSNVKLQDVMRQWQGASQMNGTGA